VIYFNIDGVSRLENPPLWVWAIVVGAIIASKFIYRWQSTRYFAREAEEKSRRINPYDDKDKGNHDFHGNISRRYSPNLGTHKYSPRRYYKDYFAIKKRKNLLWPYDSNFQLLKELHI
jgi:hypothetical protein